MRKLRAWSPAGGALLFAAVFLARPQTAGDPLDPLKACAATQRLIFENAFVRVIDDAIPVGVSEPRHRHPHGVVVYLTDYAVEQTSDDGRKTVSQRKAGTASWSEAVIHTVRNPGPTPSHAIRIELKF
jgi:hypothetical protein